MPIINLFMQNLVVNYILTDIYHIYIYIHIIYTYIYSHFYSFFSCFIYMSYIYVCCYIHIYVHVYIYITYTYINIYVYENSDTKAILGLHYDDIRFAFANIFTRNLQFDIVEYIFRSCDHIQQTLKFRQKQFDCPSNELYISSIYHAPKIQTSHRKFFVCFRRVPPNKCLVVDVFNVLM